MKPSINIIRHLLTILFLAIGFSAMSQHQDMQYFRANDKTGLNVFETTKGDTTSFHNLKVKVGGMKKKFQTNALRSAAKSVGRISKNIAISETVTNNKRATIL